MGTARPRVSPMFPLGTVLLPGGILPLHLFEPRYRRLIADVLEGDHEFGVVLIERGSEVGGGDTRSEVGTMARVLSAEEFPDGRWAVVAVGHRRIRVVDWEPDDPYPMANVQDWPDEVEADPGPEFPALVAAAEASLGVLSVLIHGLGPEDVGSSVDRPTEPTAASFSLSGAAPMGPLDRQGLLCAPGPRSRLGRLVALLDEQIATLEAERRMDDG